MQRTIRNYTKTFNGADTAQRFSRDDSADDVILRGDRDLHAPVKRHVRLGQHDPIPPDVPPPSEEDEEGAFRQSRHAIGGTGFLNIKEAS